MYISDISSIDSTFEQILKLENRFRYFLEQINYSNWFIDILNTIGFKIPSDLLEGNNFNPAKIRQYIQKSLPDRQKLDILNQFEYTLNLTSQLIFFPKEKTVNKPNWEKCDDLDQLSLYFLKSNRIEFPKNHRVILQDIFLHYERPMMNITPVSINSLYRFNYFIINYSPGSQLLELRGTKLSEMSYLQLLQKYMPSINRYSDIKFSFDKMDILALIKFIFGRNAKIKCEGESITERGFKSKSDVNLFSETEFKQALSRRNYNIVRMLVNFRTPLIEGKEFPLKIYPQMGRISFTKYASENEIRGVFDQIEEIKCNPSLGRNQRDTLDYFLRNT